MVNPQDKIYGKRLRNLRLQKDFQQKQVAELLGLQSQQIYSKLENGKKHFTKKIISDICRVFEIEVEQFTNVDANETATLPLGEKEASAHLKLIKVLEEEIVSHKIIELYTIKTRLEHELKIIGELIEEKLSKRYLFFDQEKEKVYLCTLH